VSGRSAEAGSYRADCGTLVVPEDRADPHSRLIALPVIRIRARSAHPLAPVFWLSGGPGTSNMKFPQASRLAARHDVILVGYRGVDGSSVLACPEVTAALASSAGFLTNASIRASTRAFAACAHRLQSAGVDLAGYTSAEQAGDIEAARVALGYPRSDLLSESAGSWAAMIYTWRYPARVDRSVMLGVNPPGHYLFSGTQIDQGIGRYSALCAHDPSCRARTANLAASRRHTAAHMPGRWYILPIHPGNVKVGTFLGLTEATSAAAPLSGPMTLDSWISATHGDPSGMWLISMMAGLILPQSHTWGEMASIGMADAHTAQRYFSSATGRGSIIGNPVTQLVWAGGGLLDCGAVGLDALLIAAGQVGMIMAGFVPNSRYKRSKNRAGRPDLNRRPLDPQSHAGDRWTSLKRAERAFDLPKQWPGMASCRLESFCVGSWNGSMPPAERRRPRGRL
jgi:pimeloyl-ACP methyl ester carboxylesterase